jgi:hypothetical protein
MYMFHQAVLHIMLLLVLAASTVSCLFYLMNFMLCTLLLFLLRLQVLLGYRLQWPRPTAKALMSAALAYYIATRLLQTVMVLYMIIGWASYPAARTTPAVIVVATLFGTFSVIQAYTLVIYRAIGQKLGKNKKVSDYAADGAAAEEA